MTASTDPASAGDVAAGLAGRARAMAEHARDNPPAVEDLERFRPQTTTSTQGAWPDPRLPRAMQWRLQIERARVGPILFAVAVAYADHGDKHGADIRPGSGRIAVMLGMTPSVVRDATARLVELGWLSVVARGGSKRSKQATVYRLTVPAAPRLVDPGRRDFDVLAAEWPAPTARRPRPSERATPPPPVVPDDRSDDARRRAAPSSPTTDQHPDPSSPTPDLSSTTPRPVVPDDNTSPDLAIPRRHTHHDNPQDTHAEPPPGVVDPLVGALMSIGENDARDTLSSPVVFEEGLL